MEGKNISVKYTPLDPGTVKRRTEELQNGSEVPKERIRKAGGGGKKIIEK